MRHLIASLFIRFVLTFIRWHLGNNITPTWSQISWIVSSSLGLKIPAGDSKWNILFCTYLGQSKGSGTNRQGIASPTSHPWTLILIERTIKYKCHLLWSLLSAPTPLSAPLFLTSLCAYSSNPRSRLHAGPLLACICIAAHYIYWELTTEQNCSAHWASV